MRTTTVRIAFAALVGLFGAAVAAPAAAQEWQVARESFAFAGHRLTIYVDAEAPGTLQVIRGAPGSVRVASRAAVGFTAAGLGHRDELTLTTAGPGPVDYMVSVPERVWVEVRLPGRSSGQTMGGHARSRSFEWGRAAEMTTANAPTWLPASPPQGRDTPLYTTYAATAAPLVVSLPELDHVRSVSVRIQGDAFRVSTSRPLSVGPGAADRLEIRPGAPAMDIVIDVPPGTDRFRLEAAGRTALVLEYGRLHAICSPVTQQWLSDERRWVTFNPVDASLSCAAETTPSTPRHEG